MQFRHARNEVVSVTDPLDCVLVELEQFGKANDASAAERTRRMLNITRDTGEFLAVLVRATLARRVLEIGTSNGYSTLWLANAARAIGGSVTTVELADYKIGLATANFARAGLARYISIVHDDAGRVLESSADASYDLVFLDSERPEYPGWWPNLRRVLRPGGLLVADNATSHPEQMEPFVALVSADAEFSTSLVRVGNGEFLAVRSLCRGTKPIHAARLRPDENVLQSPTSASSAVASIGPTPGISSSRRLSSHERCQAWIRASMATISALTAAYWRARMPRLKRAAAGMRSSCSSAMISSSSAVPLRPFAEIMPSSARCPRIAFDSIVR